MQVELSKSFRFEAAHRLPMLPPEHKCHRMHGHSFQIEITVTGPIDPKLGWLIDFDEITSLIEPIVMGELDHRVLNEVQGLENATSENLSVWVWNRVKPLLPQLSAITVHETAPRGVPIGELSRDVQNVLESVRVFRYPTCVPHPTASEFSSPCLIVCSSQVQPVISQRDRGAPRSCGHEVLGLTRSRESAATLEATGIRPVLGISTSARATFPL
jgi:6-pyruvoyltetrahydropterin/6-carboxytetrahydropterin synthase